MSRSANLSMPLIMPSQAQKHVTHNEAIELLDILVQLRIAELDVSAPPLAPTEGQVFAIGAEASGDFEGREGHLACFCGGGWLFLEPQDGFRAWIESDAALHVHQEGTWRPLSAGQADEVAGLGVNATWDPSNRLAIASPGTLFSHDGAGHRLTLNKAAEAETASLVFQDSFTGHAEFGLAGTNDFSVKVSSDGETWTTAFSVEASSGTTAFEAIEAVRIEGEAVQASPEDTTPGRLMRADWGYGPGNLLGPVSTVGGTPAGAVIERGSNADGEYVRFADGTQICSGRVVFPSVHQPEGAIFSSGATDAEWTYPVPFSAPPSVTGARMYTGGYWMIGPAASPADLTKTFRGRIAAATSASGDRALNLCAIGTWS